MDITPYVEGLRRDLLDAAGAGDEQTRDIAERLSLALAPAARLAIMEAVSQAAAEITSEMTAGCCEVRLEGRDLSFVLSHDVPEPPAPPAPPPPPAPEDEDDDAISRVTLRLPESVKNRAEELATTSGQSLNAWLVNTIRTATSDSAIRVDVDLSSLPFGGPFGRGPKRITGWA
ncbi:pilus assembly protein HicB [Nocardioides limicola]|uniref:pilus assembly protein HicB n=1 Tax=Nocardioides limicola TaxID=2803368 RepID=UPI001EEFD81D|nr:pilus assembly protein HicB [Nocardioides sp. DJM-14]